LKQEAIKKIYELLEEIEDNKNDNETAMTGDGIHINSGFLNGLNKEDAISKVISWLEENKIGTRKINYKTLKGR